MYNEENAITLVKINSVEDPLFPQVKSLLESAFIPDERRDIDNSILERKDFYVYAVLYQDKFIGFRTLWDLGDFVLTENGSILEHIRGQGLGSKVYKKFLSLFPNKSYIGEVERPDTEIAERRINFYKRLGYHINTYDYIQPSYSPDKQPVPMYLISYPNSLNEQEYENIKNKIYDVVYNV